MEYLSLFSGIGGFELGIQQAYENKNKLVETPTDTLSKRNIEESESRRRVWEYAPNCIGFSEIDKYAIQTYQKHFNHKNYGDITKINEKELPDFDLLVGGFPCQSFSIAGKRKGFEDTRGTMFFEIARIIKEKQPRFLLLENVKGLLSHDKGNTFTTIISTLDELGYDLQWQVLNSKNFGVPQNRERVFIIGHLRGTSRPEVFPIVGTNEKALEQLVGGSQGMRVYSDKVSTTIAGLAGGWGAKTGLYAIPVLTPDRPIKRQNGRRFKEDGEPSFTLTGQDKHGVFDGAKIRRLAPTECERLQGFPDGWTKEGLSSIMEICVNISPAIEKQLPKLDTASSITKDGNVMELQSYPNGLRSDVSIVVEKLLPVNSVIDIISRGNAMVMLYSQNETLSKDELTKLNHILEKTEEKSTKTLLKICLEGNWNEEKLSTILTLIKETIASPTSTFAKIDENIIGVIIVLNKLEQNYSSEALLGLKMVSIVSISDTQRYKCLGNAVTTNVITAIGKRLLSFS